MVSEETTLQSLLRNRKIVRNYKESKLEFPQLSEVAEHAIKIPTAGFSRGIEIVHISEKENISINTALGRMRYALINMRKLIEKHNLVTDI